MSLSVQMKAHPPQPAGGGPAAEVGAPAEVPTHHFAIEGAVGSDWSVVDAGASRFPKS